MNNPVLTIGKSQHAALIDANLGNIAQNLQPYLREFHADATAALDDELLLHRTTVGLRRARRWGFETNFGLSLFVALMFEVAPDFDTEPKIHALLSDETLPLDARLEDIEDTLSEDEWDRLAERGDPGVWER